MVRVICYLLWRFERYHMKLSANVLVNLSRLQWKLDGSLTDVAGTYNSPYYYIPYIHILHIITHDLSKHIYINMKRTWSKSYASLHTWKK